MQIQDTNYSARNSEEQTIHSRNMNKEVVIIQRTTPQYRIPFFELLRSELASKSIRLRLIYGEKDENKKNDFIPINWATYRRNRLFRIGKYSLVWSPVLSEIENADLIIINQHNSQLVNYLLLFRRLSGRKGKIAFWDHARNMQIKKNSLRNKLKKVYMNYCDWWFAYTNGVKKSLIENGYPENKITVVQNSIDTKSYTNLYHSISQQELNLFKKKHGISENDIVGIYCGGLYKEKRIDFLLSSAEKIHADNQNFKLIILGDGPDRNTILESIKTKPWLIWAGSRFGREKCLFFKVSDFFLIPGLIGLAVLDSFTFECPIVTTNYEFHSPEFEYLENGVHGIVTANNLTDYTDTINLLIRDRSRLLLLKKNCSIAASKYSIENMVSNFVNGITQSLH